MAVAGTLLQALQVGVPAAQSQAGPASPAAARWVLVVARLSEEKETRSDPVAWIPREGVGGDEHRLSGLQPVSPRGPGTQGVSLNLLPLPPSPVA